jgi:hypothetical protein
MEMYLRFDLAKKRIVFANGLVCQANDVFVKGISGTNFQVSKQTAYSATPTTAQKLKSTFDFLKNPTKLQAFFWVDDLIDRRKEVFINLNTCGL